MKKEKEPERKSARLKKRRKVPTPSVSPKRGELFAEVEIEDSVLVTLPGETSSTPRSGSSDLNPDRQDPDPEGEAAGSEEDAMTRLKYKSGRLVFRVRVYSSSKPGGGRGQTKNLLGIAEGRSVEVVPRRSGSGPERLETTHHDFLTSIPGSRRRSKSAGTTQQDDHENIRIRAEVWATGKSSYLEVNYGDRP
jgi:hypothetical protein